MTNSLFAPPALGTLLSLTGLPGGGNKIYDRSPYDNIGTITGATWKRLPSGLWCLSFDGVDDVANCGKHSSLSGRDEFTLKAWINATDAGQGGYGRIFYKTYIDAYMNNGENIKINCYINDVWEPCDITGTVTYGVPHHLVVIYDKVNVLAYLDTVKTIGDAATGQINDHSSYDLLVGNRSGIDRCFNGSIVLPEWHKGAWTDFDVQNSYNREKHLFGVW